MEYNLVIHSARTVPLTYESAIAEIEALEARGWRLGLDRMAAFCFHAGLDRFLGGEGGPQYIHVAGTNGKGSTNAFIESLLRHAGFETGAFYSPYVRDYRERIQSNGHLIAREDLARLTGYLLDEAERFGASEFGGITKFEFEAALGFKYWGELGCDWVALEVGLGGRLDATNVVRPACSVIVSIGLDHVSILGDTLGKIAEEKAGIIKPGVPVVVGSMPGEARDVIQSKLKSCNSEIWEFGREVLLETLDGNYQVTTPRGIYRELTPGLAGKMQAHNMALAIGAVELAGLSVSEDVIRLAVREVWIPGRFEEHTYNSIRFVFDGAHNPDAAEGLIKTLLERYSISQPWVLVANTLSGHDSGAFYEKLEGRFDHVVISPIDSARALSPEASREVAKGFFANVYVAEDSKEAVREAVTLAGKDGVVLVTGSNYLAGEILNILEAESISE